MSKFNGKVTLATFKKAAVQIHVFHSPDDNEWRRALEQARTWRRAAAVLPTFHPMRAIISEAEGEGDDV